MKLIFDKAIAHWLTDRQWHPEQKFRKLKDGRLEMTFKAVGMYEVERWVLSWGGDVEVVEPSTLRNVVIKTAKRMLQYH